MNYKYTHTHTHTAIIHYLHTVESDAEMEKVSREVTWPVV